ncbi:MAG TPA: dienelactone hydrolase family protein [Stellaceae bacterium]|nr:dienelactone hydrolase family protein [Stellaceae bacterium]
MNKLKCTAAAVSCALAILAFAATAQAKIVTKTVDYTIGSDPFQGYLAYDDATKGKRAGVVVFPAWTGISSNERDHAHKLAKLGYVVFVADTYGKGINPKPPKDAGMEAGRYMKDRNLYRAHAQAALAQLAKNPMVDANRIAAIGYCFGGAGALELARSGANLKAVVVFHADLTSPTPDDDKNIKGRVLALHGADDPIVPQAEREKFEKEMRDARLDWQLVTYSNAMHCFTDAEAGTDTSHGCAYNPEAEKRSFQAMRDFFQETLR